MKKVDKYLIEILASTNPGCEIFRLRTGGERCRGLSCDECNEANKEWLEAEYVEPEIDWSKVPMGTPVRVWNNTDKKYEKTFIAYHENSTCPFMTIDMTTENVGKWKYAELIEVDNENSNTND